MRRFSSWTASILPFALTISSCQLCWIWFELATL